MENNDTMDTEKINDSIEPLEIIFQKKNSIKILYIVRATGSKVRNASPFIGKFFSLICTIYLLKMDRKQRII